MREGKILGLHLGTTSLTGMQRVVGRQFQGMFPFGESAANALSLAQRQGR